MATDPLSGSDDELAALLTRLIAGLPVPDPALAAAAGAWKQACAAAHAAQVQASAAVAGKRTARQTAMRLARQKIRQVQADPSLAAPARTAMGLRVRDTKPTRVPPPSTAPMLVVLASGIGQHTFRYHVGAGDAGVTRRAKPRGVTGVELYIASPDVPPESPLAQLAHFALITRSPTTLPAPAALVGKRAWYQARWRTARGQVGPWSERVDCTVLA